MAGPPGQGSGPDGAAQRAADRLALALEEAGFDVGRAFPMLAGGVDRRGVPGVELGRVTTTVADRLSAVLTRAAEHGVATSAEDDGPSGGWPPVGHDPGE